MLGLYLFLSSLEVTCRAFLAELQLCAISPVASFPTFSPDPIDPAFLAVSWVKQQHIH